MTFSKIKLFGPVLVLLLGQAVAQGLPPKIIVKYRDQGASKGAQTILSNFKASDRVEMSGEKMQVRFKSGTGQKEIQEAINSFKQDPNVEYVEEDIVMQAFFEPGDEGSFEDSSYNQQWSLFDPVGGIQMPQAWDQTRGGISQVIAIVDTGITNHPDFGNKILSGADMISDLAVAGDGNSRDTDARDPGDWIGFNDPCYQGSQTNSSWHGTHVAGIASAVGGNGRGIAGVSWNSKILPIRVLGKCGGYSSDIADGIRWAAGIGVAGLPINTNPAKVINLSLGGGGACGQTMQSAVDEAIARGSLVVVAAGNESSNLDFTQVSPANCEGVLTVGATNRDAQKTGYSNFGERVDVMAPGGDFMGPILSTYNTGKTSPGGQSYLGLNGTSMAAPHVAGAASLVFSIRPDLFPLQVKEMIEKSARFISCPESQCGKGLLDVDQLLGLALQATPDPRFEGREPIRDGGQQNSSEFQSSNNGGGCGSIDLNGSGGPGQGGPLILSLMFLMLLMGQKMKTRLF
jgi:serine protease